MRSGHTYLCAFVCILFTSLLLISDVTARSTNLHNSNGYSTHKTYKGTNSHYKRHASLDKNRGRNQVATYPSSPGHKLSGNSESIYKQTNQGHDIHKNHGRNQAANYPSSPEHRLSGNSGTIYKQTNQGHDNHKNLGKNQAANYPSSPDHTLSGNSGTIYKQTNQGHDNHKNHGKNQAANYPSSPDHKLSGNSGTIYKQTNQGHDNHKNHGKNQAANYPSSPEQKLSGNAGGSHLPDKNVENKRISHLQTYQTTQKTTYGNRHQGHNYSSNTLSDSGQKPAFSASRFETTIAPSYIYSSAQKPSYTQPTFTSDHGSIQNSPLKNKTVSGSTNVNYPAPRPGALSGTGITSSTYGNPSSNNQSPVFNQRQIPAQYYSPNLAATNHSDSTLYPNSRPGSLSGSGSNSSGYGHPSSNVQTNHIAQMGSTNNVSSRNVTFHPVASPGTTSGGGSSSGGQLYSTPRPNFTSSSGNSPFGYGNPSFNQHTNNISQFGFPQQPFVNTNAQNGPASYPVSRPGSYSGGASGGTPTVVVSQTGSNGGSIYSKNNYLSSNQSPSWGTNTPVHHDISRPIVHYQVNHHHYIYKPPTVIHYGTYQEKPISFPIYTQAPPQYVFDYQTSNNKYKHLLTGLALYNLGRSSANTNSNNFYETYKPEPGERCTFGVKYRSGYDEQMEIDCRTITYFIYEDQPLMLTYLTKDINNNTWPMTQLMYANGSLMEPKNVNNQNNLVNSQAFSNVPSSVLSQNDKALLNQMLSTNAQQAQQIISQNGVQGTNSGQQIMLSSNGQITSNMQEQNNLASNGQWVNGANNNIMQQSVPNVMPTTNQVRSITDPQLSGNLVVIEKDMECYVTRNTRSSNMKKSVPCDLLKKYSVSIRNSGGMLKSSLFVILVTFIFVFSYQVCNY